LLIIEEVKKSLFKGNYLRSPWRVPLMAATTVALIATRLVTHYSLVCRQNYTPLHTPRRVRNTCALSKEVCGGTARSRSRDLMTCVWPSATSDRGHDLKPAAGLMRWSPHNTGGAVAVACARLENLILHRDRGCWSRSV
jgi:hypothetical protein